MKCTISVDGELTESFEMFCKVLSYCWSTMDTSLLESTRLASPDMSTGVPYKIRILKEAVGFDLLPLAKPQETTEPRAFLKADTLRRMFGTLPLIYLTTQHALLVQQIQLEHHLS